MIDEEPVCKHFETEIYEYCSKPIMESYWNKKRALTKDSFPTVAWSAIHDAGNDTSKTRAIWIVKHSTGICGVNSVLTQWKQRDDPHCSRCGQVETALHVWRCIGAQSAQLWHSSLTSLSEWMHSVHTDPIIIDTILHNLR